MQKLSIDFYDREDILTIAKETIGKVLVTHFNGIYCAARIVECEAYNGIIDKASHAYKGRRTPRNEVMYAAPGTVYVYISYGLHHLINLVTNKKEIPHAILIRAVEPLQGHTFMQERRNKKAGDFTITKGPGNLSVAMGITVQHNGAHFTGKHLYLADDGYIVNKTTQGVSKRIGIGPSGEAVDYLYRFYLKGNPYVSGSPK